MAEGRIIVGQPGVGPPSTGPAACVLSGWIMDAPVEMRDAVISLGVAYSQPTSWIARQGSAAVGRRAPSLEKPRPPS